jgi:hypothetical protein
MKWTLGFSLACVAFITAILMVGWAANGFTTAGLSTTGIVAITGGATVTALLAVALMALVFYSNRSGQDDQ